MTAVKQSYYTYLQAGCKSSPPLLDLEILLYRIVCLLNLAMMVFVVSIKNLLGISCWFILLDRIAVLHT